MPDETVSKIAWTNRESTIGGSNLDYIPRHRGPQAPLFDVAARVPARRVSVEVKDYPASVTRVRPPRLAQYVLSEFACAYIFVIQYAGSNGPSLEFHGSSGYSRRPGAYGGAGGGGIQFLRNQLSAPNGEIEPSPFYAGRGGGGAGKGGGGGGPAEDVGEDLLEEPLQRDSRTFFSLCYQRYFLFYYSPAVKFFLHSVSVHTAPLKQCFLHLLLFSHSVFQLSYIAYLVLYAYVLLYQFRSKIGHGKEEQCRNFFGSCCPYHACEWLLFFWQLTFILEMIRIVS